jgi:hypothetical protein
VSWLQSIEFQRVHKVERRIVKSSSRRPGSKGSPVKWNGKVYPSLKDCAKANGLTRYAMKRRLRFEPMTTEEFAEQIVRQGTDENNEPKNDLSVPGMRYLELAREYLKLKKESQCD